MAKNSFKVIQKQIQNHFTFSPIYSQVKDVYLHPEPFSVQNGLLTPTFKYKRLQLKSYFKPQIEDMYKKLG